MNRVKHWKSNRNPFNGTRECNLYNLYVNMLTSSRFINSIPKQYTYSASKSIFRFGTDPKLLGRYEEVSKGCGLLDPVNLKMKNNE